jgi:hypothetical protein
MSVPDPPSNYDELAEEEGEMKEEKGECRLLLANCDDVWKLERVLVGVVKGGFAEFYRCE